MNKPFGHLLIVCYFFINVTGCTQGSSRSVLSFENTVVYDLAIAVEQQNLYEIEKIVHGDKSLMEFSNPDNGYNALALSIYLEKFESFKKLLDLGANPNYKNPLSLYSVLIEACKYYNQPEPWSIDLRFCKELLQAGADPNYRVEREHVDQKGHTHLATSAMQNAARTHLSLVKMLIKFGANPLAKLSGDSSSAFSTAMSYSKIDIVNFFIDSLKVDVFEPMSVYKIEGSDEKRIFYIQDYAVNKRIFAKLQDENVILGKDNQEIWSLILKLESLGVDFRNYDYHKKYQ